MSLSSSVAMPEVPTTSTRPPWLARLALTLPFLLLYWVDLVHHQLWRDEINAWGIAVAAPTLSRLLYYVHFEAHPWLWYVILWIPSRFTHDPAALKWVEGIFGTAIYLVLGLLSPFTRLQKVLIFASYYVVFEYTVMSRMYSVMFLLALIYVLRRVRKPDSLVVNLGLLGLLANTDMTGVLLSGALLIEYVHDRWSARGRRGWSREDKRRGGWAVLLYVALLALSIYSLLPSPEISWQTTGHVGAEMFERHRIAESIGNLTAAPWWPISRDYPRRFWETDSMEFRKLLFLVPFVLVAYWRIFRRHSNLLLLMGLTLGFGALFADVVYAGRARHWGIAFVSFLVALWMQRAARERAGEAHASRWSGWAYALMGMSALAGVLAIVSSWTHPFSQARNTADWIRTHEAPDVPIVGQWDFVLANVAEQMQRPVYFMECACTDSFMLFSRDRDKFKMTELPARLSLAMTNLRSSRLLLLMNEPLTTAQIHQLRQQSLVATPLVSFGGSEEEYESFYVYSVTRP